ncbi:MAG: hypothetical protein Q4C43_05370 [Prevotella sp.]|nr:hypothetical protein [Prevotella sp.]
MKKIFTLCSLFVAACANAQTLTTFSTEDVMDGYQLQDISNNGKYIGGVTMSNAMFVIDVETKKAHVAELLDDWGGEVRGMSNTGIGVGYNGSIATLSMDGECKIIEEATEEFYGMGEDITDDGRIIVGALVNTSYGDSWQKRPCIWVDGVRTMLPEPTGDELCFSYNGAVAKHVSADGSVILGYAIDDMSTFPAVLWVKDGDTYKLDPIYKGRFRPIEWSDEAQSHVSLTDDPYVLFQFGAISANGKYVVVAVSEYLGTEVDEEWGMTFINQTERRLGVYDVENKTLNVITVDGNHNIDAETSLTPSAISNDGTVVGYTGEGGFGEPRYGFIMKAGETQPRLLADVFSGIEQFAIYDMNTINNVTAITGDGRYIAGFGYNTTEIDFGDGVLEPYPIIEAYVLDTQGDSDGIRAITENETETSEYFTIDGRKVDAPVKGLNIIRTSNGETKKVIVK